MTPRIYLIGLNHRTASVEIREQFALAECMKDDAPVIPAQAPLREVVVLSTCNRVEILAAGDEGAREAVLEAWANLRGKTRHDLEPYVYIYEDLEAVRHLFTVACSLDSMVLGEPQILGQLKEAYRDAVQRNTTKVVLNRLLHKAFSVAKRVRTETAIGASAVSISYAAVELAKRIFGEMKDYKAMLIGAGEMAELAAAHLLQAGIQEIMVANRTFARAEDLAQQFNGRPVAWDNLFERLVEADIVISSTGAPNAVIHARDIKGLLKKRKNKPMFFIDIAVPRDIDPDVNSLDNVYLYDIDDLREVVEENLAQRQDEANRARAIVESETTSFSKWLKSLELKPTIVDLVSHGEAIADKEVEKTLKRLEDLAAPGNHEEMREALDVMVKSLVRKLYHDPITYLKRRSEEEDPAAKRQIDLVRRIFNLDGEDIPREAHQDRKSRVSIDGQSDDSDDPFDD